MLIGFIVWLVIGAFTGYYVMFKHNSGDAEKESKKEEFKAIISSDTSLAIIGFILMSLLFPLSIPKLIVEKIKK